MRHQFFGFNYRMTDALLISAGSYLYNFFFYGTSIGKTKWRVIQVKKFVISLRLSRDGLEKKKKFFGDLQIIWMLKKNLTSDMSILKIWILIARLTLSECIRFPTLVVDEFDSTGQLYADLSLHMKASSMINGNFFFSIFIQIKAQTIHQIIFTIKS